MTHHLGRFLQFFCASPWCDRLVSEQQSWLKQVLGHQFGYVAVQLGSAFDLRDAWRGCPIQQHWLMTNKVLWPRPDIVADYDALPFTKESLDLVLLHYVLEQVDDPYLLLREVESLLIKDGRLMVMGFLPLNTWRGQWFGRHKQAASQLTPLGPGRVVDALQALGFEIQQVRFFPSHGWRRWLPWLDTPFTQGYALLAQKKTARIKLIGLRDGWRWQAILPQLAQRNIMKKVGCEKY